MQIELRFFQGLPLLENGLKNLETALQEEDLDVSLEMFKVTDGEVATWSKFPATSPRSP